MARPMPRGIVNMTKTATHQSQDKDFRQNDTHNQTNSYSSEEGESDGQSDEYFEDSHENTGYGMV